MKKGQEAVSEVTEEKRQLVLAIAKSLAEKVDAATSVDGVVRCLENHLAVAQALLSEQLGDALQSLPFPSVDKFVDSVTGEDDTRPDVTADYRAGRIDFAEFIRRRGGNVVSIPPSCAERP